MKTKPMRLWSLSILVLLLVMTSVSATTLSEWALMSDANAGNVNNGVTASALSSAGVTAAHTSNGITASTWSKAAITEKYYEFSVAAKRGYSVDIDNISLDYYMNSNVGPKKYDLVYYVGSSSSGKSYADFTKIGTETITKGSASTTETTSFSKALNSGDKIFIRFYAHGATYAATSGGALSVKNLKVGGTTTKGVFCEDSEVNTADLRMKIDIENKVGSDNDIWFPLNIVEVEVEVENDKENDLDNVIFELGLFKSNDDSKNYAEDLIWLSEGNEDFKVGDIKDGKKKSHTFKFRINPDVDAGDYSVKVKAYPEDNEKLTCIESSEDFTDFGSSEYDADVDIRFEDDEEYAFIVDTYGLPDEIAVSCGQEFTLKANVYNIGEQDYEDRIKLTLSGSDLGIHREDVIMGDFDSGDMGTATFNFKIPENADQKVYVFKMRPYYDYDEEDGSYDERGKDSFSVNIKVDGGCVYASAETTGISGSLQSGGVAGEDLSVNAIITNTGRKAVTYAVSLSGESKWAASASVNPSVVTIGPGQSKEIKIDFKVRDSASGNNRFKITLFSSGKLITDQSFSVEIQEMPTALDGLFANLGLGMPDERYIIWMIVGANLFLFLLMILILRRR